MTRVVSDIYVCCFIARLSFDGFTRRLQVNNNDKHGLSQVWPRKNYILVIGNWTRIVEATIHWNYLPRNIKLQNTLIH